MSSPTLLVVCGDAGRRDRFVSILSEAGWRQVSSVSGLSEAARQIRNVPNMCAIVDADLADMPGPRAVQILREFCPRAKIIFATPTNTRDLEAQVRALNVFYYYINSTDKAELVEAVRDAIGAPTPGAARHPPKVLIVDDDRGFHDSIRVFLEFAGYSTLSAYSEREGLDVARRERPDAILLDIIMESVTDGFEFCREARRDPQIKHTPIIGISAIEEKIALHCPPDRDVDLFPVDGYLRKPVAAAHLLAELKRLLPEEG